MTASDLGRDAWSRLLAQLDDPPVGTVAEALADADVSTSGGGIHAVYRGEIPLGGVPEATFAIDSACDRPLSSGKPEILFNPVGNRFVPPWVACGRLMKYLSSRSMRMNQSRQWTSFTRVGVRSVAPICRDIIVGVVAATTGSSPVCTR